MSHTSFTAHSLLGNVAIKTECGANDVSFVYLSDRDLDVWLFFQTPADRLAFMRNAIECFQAELAREPEHANADE